jgi:hypothetical protein
MHRGRVTRAGAGAGSNCAEPARLQNLPHAATKDHDKALIAQLTIDFIKSAAGHGCSDSRLNIGRLTDTELPCRRQQRRPAAPARRRRHGHARLLGRHAASEDFRNGFVQHCGAHTLHPPDPALAAAECAASPALLQRQGPRSVAHLLHIVLRRGAKRWRAASSGWPSRGC